MLDEDFTLPKHIHPLDPNDVPPEEIVPVVDTDAMIEKALEQYDVGCIRHIKCPPPSEPFALQSLNTTVRALDMINHAIIEHEALLRELSQEIGKAKREAKLVAAEIDRPQSAAASVKSEKSSSMKKFVTRIQLPGRQPPMEMRRVEKPKRSYEESVQRLAELKSKIEELSILLQEETEQLEVLRLERDEFQWTRLELDELLAQVFDGPSMKYTHEDDLEDEVKSCEAFCERVSEVIRKYKGVAESVSKASSEIGNCISLIREAKSLCDISYSQALQTYDRIQPASRKIISILTDVITVVSAFRPPLEEFGQVQLASEAGFKTSPTHTPSKSEFYSFIQHLRKTTEQFLALKADMETLAAQIPPRIAEAQERLRYEEHQLDVAKSKHCALRKQIIDHAWWERTASQGAETESLLTIDYANDQDPNNPETQAENGESSGSSNEPPSYPSLCRSGALDIESGTSASTSEPSSLTPRDSVSVVDSSPVDASRTSLGRLFQRSSTEPSLQMSAPIFTRTNASVRSLSFNSHRTFPYVEQHNRHSVSGSLPVRVHTPPDLGEDEIRAARAMVMKPPPYDSIAGSAQNQPDR
ncbi:hypothetical protein BJ742DRAFT_819475 [Cladochytrium replicatum]|nr:hypothetical protein BJ742DRAFT_819475 [Cladochytrium replicatum]